MIKKTLLLSLTLLLLSTSTGLSQDATSSSSTSVEEIQKSLQDRIRRAIQTGLNTEVSNEPKLKAFVGTVSSIAENTITIATSPTTIKHATFSEATTIVRGSSEVKPETIKIGEGIIAMGLTTDLENQTSLRLVLYEPKAPTTQRQVQLGIINQLNPDLSQLEFVPLNASGSSILKYTANTDFKNIAGVALKPSTLKPPITTLAILNLNLETGRQIPLKFVLLETKLLPSPSATQNSCGDGVCQEVVCMGIGCPPAETPETCPSDCTKN